MQLTSVWNAKRFREAIHMYCVAHIFGDLFLWGHGLHLDEFIPHILIEITADRLLHWWSVRAGV